MIDRVLVAESVAILETTWQAFRDGRESVAAVRIDADLAVLDMFDAMPRGDFSRVDYRPRVSVWLVDEYAVPAFL